MRDFVDVNVFGGVQTCSKHGSEFNSEPGRVDPVRVQGSAFTGPSSGGEAPW
jgi:hypothetical protein